MLRLHTLADTKRLAQALARQILAGELTHLFFTGSLGLGKTTCIRMLVEELPGSELAQVASPSFSICNSYPVQPPVLHADLYRCAGAIPEEILEALDDPKRVLLLEWAELLPEADWPEEVLVLHFEREHEQRLLLLTARGPKATDALAAILAASGSEEEKLA
ncbi:MAG: tRNA (adenosine(37)-N6)-threonylcarbamoyltransferase complex ATPase subunit type 1 TsaE [Desulfovibrio sp.]|nr:tRNA (adenosine(37)-N6)-threonylcarbamoyltransferase complex ATPase subunit type 1 TsaE [Desulfovibrio sp.]